MVQYFGKFPTILYDIKGDKVESIVTDIVHRARIRQVLDTNTAVFYEYVITDTDTPESIAYKYYGTTQYHWVILMSNDMFNIYFDWPLTYDNFQATIIAQFGSIQSATQTIYQYLDIFGNVIDLTTYNALPSDERSTISVYDYFFNQNEAKRKIKLLDKIYLAQIDFEMNTLLASRT